MSKDDVKDLCEADGKLQWWAMVLFAEIVSVADAFSGYRNDDKAIAGYVRSKVDEFPRLVLHRQIEKARQDRAAEGVEQ